MSRSILSVAFLVLTPALVPAADEAEPLEAKLEKVVSLKDPIDATLKLALWELADQHGLQEKIVINNEAFQADGVEDVAETMVKLPKLADVRLRVAIEKLLQQVKGVCLVRDNLIEVTTQTALKAELNLADLDPETPYRLTMPLVRMTFSDAPLSKALADLASRCDRTIVLAPQVGDKADLPMSARFANIPLDTAVELLADMADLKLVRKANALYVTTPDRAEPLLAAEEKRREIVREREKIELEKQRLEAAKPQTPK